MARIRNPWAGLWRDLTLNTLIASPLVPAAVRWRLLRAYGLNARRSMVSSGVWIGSKRMSIGEGAFINTRCMFSTHAPITIGRNAYLGMGVTVSTSTHELGSSMQRAGKLLSAPVSIGDGCWIGANATILPGITIGSGAVVAAGSVVTRDCAPNSLYAGVPALKKRDL